VEVLFLLGNKKKMTKKEKPKITIFYCINSFKQPEGPILENCDIKYVKMPCSSMTKDVYLLRAFEAGADAVLVLICPEDACRYAEGGKRARKRIEWTRGILDQIGMDGEKQLAIYNIVSGDDKAIKEIIKKTLDGLKDLEESPNK
jgi:coenzyme F420-reducing hydrogenase delta subunit